MVFECLPFKANIYAKTAEFGIDSLWTDLLLLLPSKKDEKQAVKVSNGPM